MRLSCVLFFFVAAVTAYGDCPNCTCNKDDIPLSSCPDSGCTSNCAGPARPVLIPRFGLSNGGNEVDWLIPGSPADRAGLRPGDVLLSVNGVLLPRICGADVVNGDVYSVLRGKLALTFSIPGIRMEELIARAAWPGLAQKRLPAYLYLSGLILKHDVSSNVVDDVVPNSPAYEAGIRAGDMVRGEPEVPLSSLEGGEYPQAFTIYLVRGSNVRNVNLRLRSSADILLSFVSQSRISRAISEASPQR